MKLPFSCITGLALLWAAGPLLPAKVQGEESTPVVLELTPGTNESAASYKEESAREPTDGTGKEPPAPSLYDGRAGLTGLKYQAVPEPGAFIFLGSAAVWALILRKRRPRGF